MEIASKFLVDLMLSNIIIKKKKSNLFSNIFGLGGFCRYSTLKKKIAEIHKRKRITAQQFHKKKILTVSEKLIKCYVYIIIIKSNLYLQVHLAIREENNCTIFPFQQKLVTF